MTDRVLLDHISRLPHARAAFKHLVREFGAKGEARVQLETALARLVARGDLIELRSGHFVVTARSQARIDELTARHGVAGTVSNADAVAGAGIVVIAVKPQDIDALLVDIGGLLTPLHTVLSIAAAIPTASIERQLAEGVPVVRAMPNTASTVHEGMAGVAPGARLAATGQPVPRHQQAAPDPAQPSAATRRSSLTSSSTRRSICKNWSRSSSKRVTSSVTSRVI